MADEEGLRKDAVRRHMAGEDAASVARDLERSERFDGAAWMMYVIYIMKRTQIYLDEDQDAQLSKRADSAGVTRSALIRQALDDFLQGPSDEKSRSSRFLAAVEEMASEPLTLPDGHSYVEGLRAADVVRQQELDRPRK